MLKHLGNLVAFHLQDKVGKFYETSKKGVGKFYETYKS